MQGFAVKGALRTSFCRLFGRWLAVTVIIDDFCKSLIEFRCLSGADDDLPFVARTVYAHDAGKFRQVFFGEMFVRYGQAQAGHAVVGFLDIFGRSGDGVDILGQFIVIHGKPP